MFIGGLSWQTSPGTRMHIYYISICVYKKINDIDKMWTWKVVQHTLAYIDIVHIFKSINKLIQWCNMTFLFFPKIENIFYFFISSIFL